MDREPDPFLAELADMTEELGRPPTVGELSDALGFSPDVVRTILDRLQGDGIITRVPDHVRTFEFDI